MAVRIEITLTIRNRLGLHARPAMAFVDTAKGYVSSVRVVRETIEVDGKSIMEVMMLAATQGTELVMVCEGDDAEACCEALRLLVESRFGEE